MAEEVASGTGGRSLRLRWVLRVFKEVRMSALLLMAQPGGAANQNPLTAFIPIVLIIVVFYFLLIRPQQKRAKAQKAMLDNLKAGEAVVTIGGLRGTVAAVDNDTVILRVADNVKLTFNKSAVAGVVKSE
jgi:preprotein translocase subunit YajC